MQQNKIHLFILSPPHSGSTLLWSLIKSSPHVSAFPGEGQHLEETFPIMCVPDRWNPSHQYPWKSIKDIWNTYWDQSKKILLEKTPQNAFHAEDLDACFSNSYFLQIRRNPYATCEGIKRMETEFKDISDCATLWIDFMIAQKKNISKITNIMDLTYEDLVQNPDNVRSRILNFLPQLETIDIDSDFEVHYRKSKIKDLNADQVGRLSKKSINKITKVLEKHRDVLTAAGYKPFKPGPCHSAYCIAFNIKWFIFRVKNFISRHVRRN